ncbi:alpha/beta hydrolase [candidate division WWE3 bacterium CG_4_10_14_0_2_um_filter_41_14]|uniref:Alpha/beta hydrolase n=1 Tax=candidate division WWE3 bacterium CG_4_10_14_0_2_um_filter_41_14 TaxID=1975072 RepID=A0A2M7TEQ0_UNCKA|nr:MAG: alpha/beta hydrolase [candidate division WWE3 bacterium CG_4_10_14_0_2_um_filter_41_14]
MVCGSKNLSIVSFTEISNYVLPVTSYQLRITNYELRITNYFLSNINSPNSLPH